MPEIERRPLARAEKYRARTVKMPDSLYARFTAAAVAEGESNVTTYIRGCAVIGLEYRERERAFGTYSGRPGNPAPAAGNPGGMHRGMPAAKVAR